MHVCSREYNGYSVYDVNICFKQKLRLALVLSTANFVHFKFSVFAVLFALFYALLSSVATASSSADLMSLPAWQKFSQFDDAGFVVADSKQKVINSQDASQSFIPASTTKLITALLALQHWGENHRFKTEFYLQQKAGKNILLVKGYGDPFLVSEELQMIAQELSSRLIANGIKRLDVIALDDSYYQQNLIMPGTGESDNPYDAIPSALAANFNTIYIEKRGHQLLSAEPQTPLTETALYVAKSIKTYRETKKGQVQRVNLGRNAKLNQRYFAELLAAFLTEQSIVVADKVEWQIVGQGSAKSSYLFYEHVNSRNLAAMVRPMMKYSTNFIANQMALNLAIEFQGLPANRGKVQKSYSQLLTEQFKWQSFYIEDGAGLSRKNRLTPVQLLDVLQAFKPWMSLLPEVESRVFAKSGSLIGVSTLAGYIEKEGELMPFAIMINEKGPYRFRNRLAKELTLVY